ncbi:ArsR family transcriptional regulator [Paenibacillus lautus]|uniref:ArsR family transcriptional regulator n=1 Tax=Paenibacillus lautus TaxID=1401 RepID=UPI003D9A178F
MLTLAEPHRFNIVELLRNGHKSIGEIVQALGISQPHDNFEEYTMEYKKKEDL